MYIISGIMVLFFLLLYGVKQKHYKKLIILFSVSIGIVSFFIILPNGVDLWRHYDTLDMIRNMSFKDVLQFEGLFNEDGEVGKYSNLYTYKIYMYLISKLQYNGFLPAITMFVLYLTTLLNIHRCAKEFNIAKKYEMLSIIYFVAIFNYYDASSGIRNFLAFSVTAFFLYIDVVKKERRLLCCFMYAIMAMLHTSVIIVIIIRLLILVKNKYINSVIIMLIACWSIFTPQIISVTERLGNSIDFFAVVSSQIQGNTGNDQNVIMSIGRAMFFLLMYLFIIISNKVKIKNYSADYHNFCLYIAIFMLASFRSSILFLRLNGFLLFIVPVVFMWVFDNNLAIRKINANNYKMQNVNKCIYMLIYIISMVYFMFNTFVFYKLVTF